jgi:hypothetical protein
MSNEIRLADILKIRRHKFFEDIMFCDEINKRFQSKIKILMLHAKINGGAEVMMLINNNSMEHMMASEHDRSGVSLTNKMIDRLENSNGATFTIIHNHPSNQSFSIADVRLLFNRSSIKYMFICGNNCKFVEVLGKSDMIDSQLQSQILRYIEYYKMKHNFADSYSAAWLIKYFGSRGFLYKIDKYEQ